MGSCGLCSVSVPTLEPNLLQVWLARLLSSQPSHDVATLPLGSAGPPSFSFGWRPTCSAAAEAEPEDATGGLLAFLGLEGFSFLSFRASSVRLDDTLVEVGGAEEMSCVFADWRFTFPLLHEGKHLGWIHQVNFSFLELVQV